MVENPDWDTYVGTEVFDDTGTTVGTVVDFDREAGEFYLEPSGELDVHTWESLGWHATTEYDTAWEALDYEAWREGEADVTVDYEEWPFTVPAARLEDVADGDRLRVD